MSLRDICVDLDEGVYRYKPGAGWVRVKGQRPAPGSGKPLVLVFVNVYCRDACLEIMDAMQEKLGQYIASGRVEVWLTVCTKFRGLCWDKDAKRLFYVYKVYGSPTVTLVDGRGVVVGSLKGPIMVSRGLSSAIREFEKTLSEVAGEPSRKPAVSTLAAQQPTGSR